MRRLIFPLCCLFVSSLLIEDASAKELIDEAILRALSEELSGETAKRNLEFITREHRMRGSVGYRNAAEFIARELRKYGLQQVKIEEFPADGKVFYGTQRSRPAWDAEFAELWEMKKTSAGMVAGARLASWDAMPLSLAQDSASGEVSTTLIDVGEGTSEADYANKDVKGKVVLCAQQPERVARLAIEQFGAAGIVSYAQNQKTAWWAEDENLIRWGHLDTFAKTPAFAFMVSLKQARSFQKRLASGEEIHLRARVVAGRHSGAYHVVTATIPGADPQLKNQETAFSCHLDHPRPGANDNASGCATILEVARTYAKLIAEKKIPRPARTLRFVWPPEIEGTMALLVARPEIRKRILTAIHMDMVGGGPVTKAQFHITRGPASMPSFVYDVADHFGEFVNRETLEFASTGSANFPLHSPEGGKEPLRAVFASFSMGSDHQVYSDSSFGIPAIYFNDWPDRYIHTNFDSPANIDPTKLKRAAFIGAATAFYLGNFRQEDWQGLWPVLQSAATRRAAEMIAKRASLKVEDVPALERFYQWYESGVFASLDSYIGSSDTRTADAASLQAQLQALTGARANEIQKGQTIYVRNPQIPGPLEVFGYNYLEAHYGREKTAALALLKFKGLWADGATYAYETLNFVDGKRSVEEIHQLLSGAYGPVPLEAVDEYLKALASIQVIGLARPPAKFSS